MKIKQDVTNISIFVESQIGAFNKPLVQYRTNLSSHVYDDVVSLSLNLPTLIKSHHIKVELLHHADSEGANCTV